MYTYIHMYTTHNSGLSPSIPRSFSNASWMWRPNLPHQDKDPWKAWRPPSESATNQLASANSVSMRSRRMVRRSIISPKLPASMRHCWFITVRWFWEASKIRKNSLQGCSTQSPDGRQRHWAKWTALEQGLFRVTPNRTSSTIERAREGERRAPARERTHSILSQSRGRHVW